MANKRQTRKNNLKQILEALSAIQRHTSTLWEFQNLLHERQTVLSKMLARHIRGHIFFSDEELEELLKEKPDLKVVREETNDDSQRDY